MFAEKFEGVVVAGSKVEIAVTILVKETISTVPAISTLVIRSVNECNRDLFISVESPGLEPSFLGLSPSQLSANFGPICCTGGNRIESPRRVLPMPKEIWMLMKFIHLQKHAFNLVKFLESVATKACDISGQVRQDMVLVIQCVERYESIPETVSIESVLRVSQ